MLKLCIYLPTLKLVTLNELQLQSWRFRSILKNIKNKLIVYYFKEVLKVKSSFRTACSSQSQKELFTFVFLCCSIHTQLFDFSCFIQGEWKKKKHRTLISFCFSWTQRHGKQIERLYSQWDLFYFWSLFYIWCRDRSYRQNWWSYLNQNFIAVLPQCLTH